MRGSSEKRKKGTCVPWGPGAQKVIALFIASQRALCHVLTNGKELERARYHVLSTGRAPKKVLHHANDEGHPEGTFAAFFLCS